MAFPTKEERAKCWGARDSYWECLDKHGIKEKKDETPCSQLRKLYEQSCTGQWVKHFDRKRNYLRFKEKIETDGIPNKIASNSSSTCREKRRVYQEVACL